MGPPLSLSEVTIGIALKFLGFLSPSPPSPPLPCGSLSNAHGARDAMRSNVEKMDV